LRETTSGVANEITGTSKLNANTNQYPETDGFTSLPEDAVC